jgi:hypothetical protein
MLLNLFFLANTSVSRLIHMPFLQEQCIALQDRHDSIKEGRCDSTEIV